MRRPQYVLFAPPPPPPPPPPYIPAWVSNQAAGSWLEIPGTHADSVNPCPAGGCSYSRVEGFPAIINSWSGGAFDQIRKRLVVNGGGHNAYAGDEVIALTLGDTPAWSRLTDPYSPITDADLFGGTGTNTTGYYANGSPAACHTYGTLVIDHVRDQLIRGCAHATAGETGGVFGNCDVFSFATNTWSVKANSPPLGSYGLPYASFAVSDASGNYWMFYAGLAPIAKFDPAANTWTTYGSGYNYNNSAYCTAAYDSLRNRIVVIGGGHFTKTDLSSPGTTTAVGGSPTSVVLNGQAPGFAYDPIGDRFIAWVNGAPLYTVDAATLLTWGTLSTSGATPPDDSMSAFDWRGTYNRFSYIEDYDSLILVTQTGLNAYHYKFAR